MIQDNRGTITDLNVGEDYSVTLVTFNKDSVRGNHYHKETIQVDTVLKGRLICFQNKGNKIVGKGEMVVHNKNDKHAYKALEDSVLLSVCFGKRIGDNYESDTFRLEENEKLV